MPTVRRLYLYLVALVSLMALMVGLVNVSAGLVRLWLNARPFAITGAELAGSALGPWAIVIAIAAPVWLLHWFLANSRARALTMAGAAERRAPARKAYLYAGRFGALVALAGLSGLLIYDLLLRLLGTAGISGPWPAGPLALAVAILVAFPFWLGLYLVARSDGDAGHEPGAGAGWRRAYDYLGAFLATAAAAGGAVSFLQAALSLAGRLLLPAGLGPLASAPASPANGWQPAVAGGLAAFAVGVVIAGWHWRRADWAAADDPTGGEINSLGRKLLIYAVLLTGVAGFVLSFAYLVTVLLLVTLGQPVDSLPVFWGRTLAPLLGFLPVMLILWWSFGRAVRNDLAWAPETADAAALRRLYFYLMAGILLAAFWWGLQQVLAVIAFLALGLEQPAALSDPTARSTISLAVALCLAAGPAWWWHWHRAQAWVDQPAQVAPGERAATIRKLYLYGVVVAAAVVVAVTLGLAIYRAPAWLLGPRNGTDFAAALVQLGVAVALALVWWLGYGLVMRDDSRVLAAEAAEAEEAGAQEQEAAVPAPSATEEWQAPPWPATEDNQEGAAWEESGQAPAPGSWDEGVVGPAAAEDANAAPPTAAAGAAAPRLRRGQYDRADLAAAAAAFVLPRSPSLGGSAAEGAGGARPSAAVPTAGEHEAGAPTAGEHEAGENEAMGPYAAGYGRGDPRDRPLDPYAEPVSPPEIVVVDGGRGATGVALVQALRRALPEAVLWPLGLNEAAQEAMYGATAGGAAGNGAAPDDALERALVIVGPRDIVVPGGLGGEMPPELAAAIAGSRAQKVLLPPAPRRYGAAAEPAASSTAQAVAQVAAIVAANS